MMFLARSLNEFVLLYLLPVPCIPGLLYPLSEVYQLPLVKKVNRLIEMRLAYPNIYYQVSLKEDGFCLIGLIIRLSIEQN